MSEAQPEIALVLGRELQRRHWSYRTLAREAGISSAAVGQHVLGKSVPGPATLRKYAAALGLPYQHLMVAAGHAPRPHGARSADLELATATLEEVWAELSPEVRQLASDFISSLRSRTRP